MFSDTLSGAAPVATIDSTPSPPPAPPNRWIPSRRSLAVLAAVAAVAAVAITGVVLANGRAGDSNVVTADPSGPPAPNAPCRRDLEGSRTVTHDPVLRCTKTPDGLRWLTTGEALPTKASASTPTTTPASTTTTPDPNSYGAVACRRARLALDRALVFRGSRSAEFSAAWNEREAACGS
jgi:hypothetical protein